MGIFMNANDYFSIKNDWQFEEIRKIYERPLPDLMHVAHEAHRKFHNPHEVQPCRIQSIKLGACPEDCKYCPQSSHYEAEFEKEKLYSVEKALDAAIEAKKAGATRFCMGVAWRQVKDGPQFDRILEMVTKIDKLGLEVCLTAGMMEKHQAKKLKLAGCTAYNHNLDTSPEFYGQIITTRTYQDRLDTIQNEDKGFFFSSSFA